MKVPTKNPSTVGTPPTDKIAAKVKSNEKIKIMPLNSL